MRKYGLTIGLLIALISLSIGSLFIGVIDIDMASIVSGGSAVNILILSRLPRLLAILCTGVGMSVAGLIMQQLCSNKFVSPTTGATIQSAQFGIMISMVVLPRVSMMGKTMMAFGCAMIGTWIFVGFIQKIKFKDMVMVPLVGMMFSNIIGGITSFLAYHYQVNQQLSSYLVGSFALIIKGDYELVYVVVPLVIIAFVYANHFNIVGLGKDFSNNLGISYNRLLLLGLTIASAITAAIVSIVGQISYIGLIVPNIITMFKGDKIQGTLLDTALFGALFVLICDMIARSVIMPYELPIELVIGIIGSIIFIALLLYKLRYGNRSIAISRLFKKEGGCIE